MKRSVLLVVAAVVGILRGALGTLSGLGSFALIEQAEPAYPGFTFLVVYEFTLAITVLFVSLFVLIKANDPVAAGAITVGGIAIIVGGVIDVLWALALYGLGAGIGSAVIGSIGVLTLIGTLFIVGARSLRTRS